MTGHANWMVTNNEWGGSGAINLVLPRFTVDGSSGASYDLYILVDGPVLPVRLSPA